MDAFTHIEVAASALQQAKQRMQAEHTALQKRLSTLNSMIRQLTAQQNSLRYALQRENKAQPRLHAIVEQFRSQLGQTDGPEAPVSPTPVNHTGQPAEQFCLGERACGPHTERGLQVDDVGDLFKIVPQLIEELKKRKGA
jgi:uncharacterized protein YukE